jgi:hypothetical protein
VHRLARPSEVRRVSRAERRRFRAAAFDLYLTEGVEYRLRLADVLLCGVPLLEPTAELAGTIVGFLRDDGPTDGIGVVEALDTEAGLGIPSEGV